MLVVCVCVCTLTVSFKPLLIQSFFFAFFQYVCLQQSSRHFGKKKNKKKTTEGQMSSGLCWTEFSDKTSQTQIESMDGD